MIFVGTKVKIVDNSGVKLCRCVRVCKKNGLFTGGVIGDIFIGSILRTIPKSTFKKGALVRLVVVRGRQITKRFGLKYIFGTDLAGVVLNRQGYPVGKRLKGPIFTEIRSQNKVKVVSMASYIL